MVTRKFVAALAGTALMALAVDAGSFLQGQTQPQPQEHSAHKAMAMAQSSANDPAAQPVPAYHATASSEAEHAQTLDPAQFPSDPVARNAYAMAAKVKTVLYQQPCYCYCDRSQGHGSLLSCFTSDHGAYCDVCKKEAIYAYGQTRQHKTAKQIRAGIMRGEWQKIDLAQYQTP